MWNRTLFTVIFSFLLLGLFGTGSAGATTCHFAVGPAGPVDFAPNPATGLIELTVPMTIGGEQKTVDISVAILGFLVPPTEERGRAVVTHSWHIRENGVDLEWSGEANSFATDDPTIVNYTLKLDLVEADRRYSSGTVFAQGVFSLVEGTGDARDFFAKLCFGEGR